MEKYQLRLFVTGGSPRSRHAEDNLRRICDERLAGEYSLEVIDVLKQPRLAEEARVLATPTVVKDHPAPPRRIIGDLSDTAQVLFALDLPPN